MLKAILLKQINLHKPPTVSFYTHMLLVNGHSFKFDQKLNYAYKLIFLVWIDNINHHANL